jgi:hypothetical protein
MTGHVRSDREPVTGVIGTQLSGAGLYHWIALRRVSGGRVARLGVRWLQSGRPVRATSLTPSPSSSSVGW